MKIKARESDFVNVIFKDINLIECDFSDIVFNNCKFINCMIFCCNFKSSTFTNVVFSNGTEISNCFFNRCTIYNSIIDYIKIKNNIFNSCTIDQLKIEETLEKTTFEKNECKHMLLFNICLNNLKYSNNIFRELYLEKVTGIKSSIDFLKNNFEFTEDGLIAYKTFNQCYKTPEDWIIKPGSILTSPCSSDRNETCAYGINIAPLEWVKDFSSQRKLTIYKVLIRWEWLAGVVVPYDSDGKIRCERCEIISPVDRETGQERSWEDEE